MACSARANGGSGLAHGGMRRRDNTYHWQVGTMRAMVCSDNLAIGEVGANANTIPLLAGSMQR